MPLRAIEVDDWERFRSRILLAGDANTGKTYSFLTWPRPIHIIAYPGEKGWATIKPDPANGINLYALIEEPGPKRSMEAVREVKQLTTEILSGKYGEVATFAGDGLHKLYDYMIDVASGGDYFKGVKADDWGGGKKNGGGPALYGPAQQDMASYLDTVCRSAVPNVVFTTWVALERDAPWGNPNNQMHVFPDFPGKAAKRVLGEFTATVYVTKQPTRPGQPDRRVWQLLPDDTVWGISVKVPDGIVLPKYINQDWHELQAALDGQLSPPAAK